MPPLLVGDRGHAIARPPPSKRCSSRARRRRARASDSAPPDGLSLHPAPGRLAGTPTEVRGAGAYPVHMRDRLGDADVPLRLHIDDDRYDAVAPSGTAGPAPTFTWTRASAPDDAEPVGS